MHDDALKLYGPRFFTNKWHFLLHVAQLVRDYGPLTRQHCFGFEVMVIFYCVCVRSNLTLCSSLTAQNILGALIAGIHSRNAVSVLTAAVWRDILESHAEDKQHVLFQFAQFEAVLKDMGLVDE